MKKHILLITILASWHFSLFAQDPFTLQVRDHRLKNQDEWIQDYISFLSIPNLASDSISLGKNASHIAALLNAQGIGNVQLLYAQTKGVPPAVYGEVMIPDAKETIVFYAHYDGQPVDPSKWMDGLMPFKPVMTDGIMGSGGKIIPMPAKGSAMNPNWRIYGRSASDDKAGVFAIIKAYSCLKSMGIKPGVNLKFFFEGEEEAGSDHLNEILESNKNLLKSDLWLICDGPVHQSGKKQVVFGVRGDTHIELSVYGPSRPLHSGHYGNWAPNPAMDLVRLLSTMKNEKGEVTIKNFYDDVIPLSAQEKKALQNVPKVDEQMKNELGFGNQERPGMGLAESINLPSLNINGIVSANVGKFSANVIPVKAIASIDLRLVAGNDWERQQQKVIDHIRSVGYYVTEKEPTPEERKQNRFLVQVTRSKGYNAQKTPLDLPIAQKVIKAVTATTSGQVVLMPTGGGSLPLYVFEKTLNAKTISVPIANHDNNQHAENENIRLQNLWDGIETMASLMKWN